MSLTFLFFSKKSFRIQQNLENKCERMFEREISRYLIRSFESSESLHADSFIARKKDNYRSLLHFSNKQFVGEKSTSLNTGSIFLRSALQ